MVGIIVVNYNTWEITVECIDSIRENCTIPFCIYVIDNCSPNNSYEELQTRYEGNHDVRVFETGKNGGYGFGLNCGFRIAAKDGCNAIVASNNDIFYLPGSIEKMFRALQNNSRVAIAGAQQFTPDGNRQRSASTQLYSKMELMLWYVPFIHRFIKDKDPINKFGEIVPSEIEVSYPVGGCYMLDPSLLDEGKLYDERMFMYAEEPVLGAKLLQQGRTAVLCSDAKVIHRHHATTGSDMASYHKTAAPSIYIYCRDYAGLSKAELTVHKSLYYLLMFLKCVLKKNYWKNRDGLFHAYRTVRSQ